MSRVVQPVKQTFNWWFINLKKGSQSHQWPCKMPSARTSSEDSILYSSSLCMPLLVHKTKTVCSSVSCVLSCLKSQATCSSTASCLWNHMAGTGFSWAKSSKCLQHTVFLQAELITDHRRTVLEPIAKVSADPWSPFTSDATPGFCVSAGKSKGQTLDCRIVSQWLFHQLAGWTIGDGRLLDTRFCTLDNNKNLMLRGLWLSRGHSSAPVWWVGHFQTGRNTWLRIMKTEEGQSPQHDFRYLELPVCFEMHALLLPLLPSSDLRTGCRVTGRVLCLRWNSSISCFGGCKITLRCYILILAVASLELKTPFILIYWFFRMRTDSGQKGSSTNLAGFSEGLFNFQQLLKRLQVEFCSQHKGFLEASA